MEASVDHVDLLHDADKVELAALSSSRLMTISDHLASSLMDGRISEHCSGSGHKLPQIRRL